MGGSGDSNTCSKQVPVQNNIGHLAVLGVVKLIIGRTNALGLIFHVGMRTVRVGEDFKVGGYEGVKHMRCNKCDDTQWFNEALKLKETPKSNNPLGARILIDATLEDFCTKFQTNVNFKKN
ncbi:hypothetical protein BVC80_8447g2 [Macleaya cordata]|uniref:Uncharacterized protein n=1 Tax=Macleaya cordata TaxID=56857 RepID=A0A200PT99_MACCD|nr:hypothetical protein BVC80_8447g2 [Macleaya cordata]